MHLRVLKDEEVPHYSKGNVDMEVETSYGIIETTGNAYRTDFDLSKHTEYSKKDLSIFVEEEKKRLIPHVFELSMGVDRMFFCILEHCFRDKDQKDKTGNRELGTGKDWEWFDFPPAIAPYHVAIFPLMKKDGLAEKAKEIAAGLRTILDTYYYESGSIGKRYARADEIGIPYVLTVDYDTLKDNTVTIRYRNDGKQERIKVGECAARIKENIEKNKVSL
jgi:glycyl-tRNA synthetase